MRLLLLIILAFVLLNVIANLVGPLIVLVIGAVLTYYAYKNLAKADKSLLGIILWVIVGATGVSMVIGALPGFVFVAAIVAVIYLMYRNSNSKPQTTNGSPTYKEYESFESEWRDITNR